VINDTSQGNVIRKWCDLLLILCCKFTAEYALKEFLKLVYLIGKKGTVDCLKRPVRRAHCTILLKDEEFATGSNCYSSITSGVTERLGALGHINTLGPNLSWALAGYHT